MSHLNTAPETKAAGADLALAFEDLRYTLENYRATNEERLAGLEARQGDDPLTDPSCWIKANPLLGVTITEQYLTEVVAQANNGEDALELIRKGGLDDWVRYCGLHVQERHNASADALVTAELALILFSQARRQGYAQLPALLSALARHKRRQHQAGW